MRRLDPSARSNFSVPTLSNLREALQRYTVENVRESTCHVFEGVWSGNNRIFFVAGPEELMRRSLTQFLRNRFGGDHDVWPEQNVNEKNPVDIRMMPRFTSNRLMLIEIKWLGDSVAPDGHITVHYRDARAQEGADQLAEYLDEQLRSAPSRVVHGYFVIIDGRRQAHRGQDDDFRGQWIASKIKTWPLNDRSMAFGRTLTLPTGCSHGQFPRRRNYAGSQFRFSVAG